MTANDSKSYLCYQKKLADEYNNTYCTISTKHINADYYALMEEIESSHKTPTLFVKWRKNNRKFLNKRTAVE